MEKQRQIFDTFREGIDAFVRQYNEENPTHEIKQINVGMGFNSLRKIVREVLKQVPKLKVPDEYGFKDAETLQYKIWPMGLDGEEK